MSLASVEEVTQRAMRLRDDMHSRRPLTAGATGSSFRGSYGRAPLPNGPEAELSLILAGDPLYGSQVPAKSALPPEKSSGFGASSRSSSRERPPTPRAQSPLRESQSLSSLSTLRIFVGAVHLSRRTASSLQNDTITPERLHLRYSVPAAAPSRNSKGGCAEVEDVVVASCREVRGDNGTFIFDHTSFHPIHLTAETLPRLTAQPLRLQLQLQADGSRRMGGRTVAMEVGTAEVPWHQALLSDRRAHSDCVTLHAAGKTAGSASRTAPGGVKPVAVGRVQLSISLHSPMDSIEQPIRGQADVLAYDNGDACRAQVAQLPAVAAVPGPVAGMPVEIHLTVRLGALSMHATSLHGIHAVVKLGTTQELTAQAYEDAQPGQTTSSLHPLDPANRVQGSFRAAAAMTARPVWIANAETAQCTAGPTPPRLFLQLWHGTELLGLARIPLPQLAVEVVQDICAGGHAFLGSEPIEVLSAKTCEAIGSVHLSLHAGMAVTLAQTCGGEARPMPMPAAPPAALYSELPSQGAARLQQNTWPGARGEPTASKDANAMFERADWPTVYALSAMRWVTSRASAGDVISTAGGSPSDLASKVSVGDVRNALVSHVYGLSQAEGACLAEAIADELDPSDAARGLRSWWSALQDDRRVPASFAYQHLDALRRKAEAGADGLLRAIGPACDVILNDLQRSGTQAWLSREDLGALLRGRGVQVSWEVIEDLFKLVDGLPTSASRPDRGKAALPALLLSQLVELRLDAMAFNGQRVQQLELAVARKLQGYAGRGGMSSLLRSHARSDGVIDLFGLSSLLKTLMGRDARSEDSLMLEDAELEAVAAAILRRFDGGQGKRAPLDRLAAWLEEHPSPVSGGVLDGSPRMHANAGLPELSAPQIGARSSSRSPRHQSWTPTTPPAPAIAPLPSRPQSPRKSPRAMTASLELVAPLNEQAWRSGFEQVFVEAIAQALEIPAARVRVKACSVGSVAVEFEVLPGNLREDATPLELMDDLAAQLAEPTSKLKTGALREFLSTGGMAQGSPRQLHVRTEDMSEVAEAIFEVVLRSSISLDRAFNALDRDGDGYVTAEEIVATLHELGVPAPDRTSGVLAESVMPRDRRLDLPEFKFLYEWWLSRRGDGAPPPGGIPMPAIGRDAALQGLDSSLSPRALVERQFAPDMPPVQSKCTDLPSYVLFAMLSRDEKAEVATQMFRSFAERCLGMTALDASRAAATCDWSGSNVVAYKDFRRYIAHLDEVQSPARTVAEIQQSRAVRDSARMLLELLSHPLGAAHRTTDEIVSEKLQQRGRRVDTPVEVRALQELLYDLRLPVAVAGPLCMWEAEVTMALAHERGESPHLKPKPFTYAALLGLLQRAHSLLHRHLDDLFGACMGLGVDLVEALDNALRSPHQTITVEELQATLQVMGVDLINIDIADVLLVLDPNGKGNIFVPELVASYRNFRRRFSVILGALSERLRGSGPYP
mmetsp:Transcript_55986/g.103562  ORF Transcript_55986/g.103562 Transcript_55986/m.103562 type:complete len:1463 (-) Transcript_55986:59-4447(-)